MKKVLICVLAVFLAFSISAGHGQQVNQDVIEASTFVVPKQEILGAKNPIPLGELVVLRLSDISPKPKDFQKSSVDWKVYDFVTENSKVVLKPKFAYVNNDGSVHFGSGVYNKQLYVQAIVTYLFQVKNKDVNKLDEVYVKTVVLETFVNVGGGPAPPNPPTPTPTPTFPTGKYDLSKFAYETAMSKVAAPNRVKGCTALVSGFRVAQTAIAAGTIKSLEDGLKTAKAANEAEFVKVGVKDEEWSDFGNALQDFLYKFYSDKKLSTTEDLRVAFDELIIGLSAIK